MYKHHCKLGLPAYNLLHVGSAPGVWAPLHLEEVRDRVVRQRRRERAEDRDIELSDCRFEFDPHGGAYVRFRGRSRFGAPKPLTSNAMFQLIRIVSTPKSLSMLEQLVRGGEPEDLRMASRLMKRLVERDHSGHRVRFRTVMRRLDTPALVDILHHNKRPLPDPRKPGARPRTTQVITAVVSGQYRNYDDDQLVTDLLETIEKPEKMQVISADRSTEGFVLRLSVAPKRPEAQVPYPMIELRNSEVGCGSTTVSGGLFTLICTNGMHTWKASGIHRWPHRIDADPVEDELGEVLERIGIAARSTLQDYEFARTVTVGLNPEEAHDWIAPRLRHHHMSKRFIARVVDALEDPTTSLGGGGEYLLSSVVDAITLSAQRESFTHRFELERLAGRLVEEERALAA